MNQQLILDIAKLAGFYINGENLCAGDFRNFITINKELTKFAELILQANKQDSELITAMEDGYEFHCNEPLDYLTDEANLSHRWNVSRTQAPFCDDVGMRVWTGATAFEALNIAKQALHKE